MSKYRYKDSKYKKAIKEEDAKVLEMDKMSQKKAKEAAAIFLDESNSFEERIKAANKMSRITGDDIDKALSLFRNEDLPEKLRACAFYGISGLVFSQEDVMLDAINEIKKGEGSGEIALASLNAIKAAEISSPQLYGANIAEYKDALRIAIDHKNENLRSSALEILAINKDEYAQRRLVESLEDPSKALVAPEIAVQLLSYDLHANHFKVLREVAINPPNSITKRESIRNLGFDEESKELLQETLNDLNEEPEIRHAAATALMCLNPELSTEMSKKIIIEEQGHHLDGLKTALLNTLIFLESGGIEKTHEKTIKFIEKEEEERDFKENLLKIKGTSNFSELDDMINLYLNTNNS
ncbi:hypothetical protein QLS71_016430 [Mariniflexile litorale]|uniref:HEAT repeat protein n=1 Tax=Mariniflexile litorale TaxID=3045158 RepID=A0AAU7EFS1_9FLAO|nr:hypothetical protein [Mariniflexile sp. KMM 9835]MDQ8212267.1 hypothetical protein [Mariniflexile sp. KMM 9835]